MAIFLISNTVTTGIAVRRDEIGIMKLIGATDSFVRAPFIVEGILIGLIGAILPLALLYLLYNRIVIYIEEKFSFIGSLISFVPAEGVFHTLVPVALALGVGHIYFYLLLFFIVILSYKKIFSIIKKKFSNRVNDLFI